MYICKICGGVTLPNQKQLKVTVERTVPRYCQKKPDSPQEVYGATSRYQGEYKQIVIGTRKEIAHELPVCQSCHDACSIAPLDMVLRVRGNIQVIPYKKPESKPVVISKPDVPLIGKPVVLGGKEIKVHTRKASDVILKGDVKATSLKKDKPAKPAKKATKETSKESKGKDKDTEGSKKQGKQTSKATANGKKNGKK